MSVKRSRFVSFAAIALMATAVSIMVPSAAQAHPTLTVTATPTTVPASTGFDITVSGTSNGNYTGARIDISASNGTGGTTGTLPSYTTLVACAAGPTCSEVGSVYRLALPNLANGEAFSFTVSLTVDLATLPGDFKATAQFFSSSGTTNGKKIGPPVTVTPPPADLQAFVSGGATGLTSVSYQVRVVNNGPGAADDAQFTLSQTAGASNAVFSSVSASWATCTGAGTNSVTCTANSQLVTGVNYDTNITVSFTLLTIGTYRFAHTVGTTSLDPAPGNNTAAVGCTSVLGALSGCGPVA
ncbi:hypothetical protein [Micromonospora rubida]